MAPRKTIQDIFGLKPEEVNALAVLSGLEGFRGGSNSPDVAAVAANALARRLSGQWGGKDIRNIAKAPGQYVAVDNYSMAQLADPVFGAKVLGSESEFNRLRDIVNNPDLVGQQFNRSKGAQSFRGVSAYGNKKPGDYMPVPGKSNFYFNGLNGDLYNKGVGLFKQAAVPGTPLPGAIAQGGQIPSGSLSVSEILAPILGGAANASAVEERKSIANTLLDEARASITQNILQNVFNPFGGFQ
jgi:hypothetical protein